MATGIVQTVDSEVDCEHKGFFDEDNRIDWKTSRKLYQIGNFTDQDDFMEAYANLTSEYAEHIHQYPSGPYLDLANFMEFRLKGGSIQEYKDANEKGFAMLDFNPSLSEAECQAVLDRLYSEGVLNRPAQLSYLNTKAVGGSPISYIP